MLGGAKLALKDYRLYIFLLFQHMSLLSQTFQYFFPSIVGTLGYGKIETLLLTVPGTSDDIEFATTRFVLANCDVL